MENLALLSQFPTSKTEQKEMVEQMVTALKSGNENPLRIEAAMANIEAFGKMQDYIDVDRMSVEVLHDDSVSVLTFG